MPVRFHGVAAPTHTGKTVQASLLYTKLPTDLQLNSAVRYPSVEHDLHFGFGSLN